MTKHIALLLAAGHSKRYGSDKRLSGSGKTLIKQTIASLADVYSGVVVVHRYHDPMLLTELNGLSVTFCQAPNQPVGIGTSLASGVKLIRQSYDLSQITSISICLADMPFVQPLTITELLAKSKKDNIVRPSYTNHNSCAAQNATPTLGHPVVFGKDFVEQLSSLKGDTGANKVIKQHIDKLVIVKVKDKGVIQDIDQPNDWLGSN